MQNPSGSGVVLLGTDGRHHFTIQSSWDFCPCRHQYLFGVKTSDDAHTEFGQGEQNGGSRKLQGILL